MSQILLISHIFPPAIDGGSRVIYKIGRYFETQGHQTLYLSSDCLSTDDFTKSKYQKISTTHQPRSNIYLPVYHHLRRPLKLLNLFIPPKLYLHDLLKVFQKGPIFKFIPFIKATTKIIKFRPDLIIAGPLPTTSILYARLLKMIINLHTCKRLKDHPCRLLINASFHQTDSDFFQKPLIKTLQQADFLWTLTQYETNFFIKNIHINPSKIILAGNGIDPKFLIKKSDRLTPTDSTGKSDQPNILFIGSLSAHKGLDTLINSFSLLLKANSYLLSTKLILAGQKTLFYPKIKKLINSQPKPIRSQIKFIFNFPQKKLTHLIDNCTLLVLPSNQESFGLVLIEAWARKKPVITSDIPPLKEIVNQTRGGLIFKSQNPTDLKNKVLHLINHPQLRHQLGQKGFNYVKNNYTWPIVRKKISQKISSL